jgi:glucose uptake protein
MILPVTYLSALLLLVVSMICWGSWANTFKLTGEKWRFEFFSYDFAIGLLLGALIAAYTFGTLGSELTFSDRLTIAGRKAEMYVFLGGVVFTLANMLLMAAISLAGMAVAFPIGIGLALIIGVLANYIISPQGNPILLGAGVALVMIAILLDSAAHRARDRSLNAAQPETPTKDPKTGRALKPAKRKSAARGIVISLISGVLMGAFYPLVGVGMMGELGLGAYASAIIFGIGAVVATVFFNIYFFNLPVTGDRIQAFQYLRGTPKQHLLGILGGVIWSAGAISNFAVATAAVNVGPAISLGIGQCATLVSVLWGLLVWKEFAGAPGSVKRTLALMMLFFAGGLALLSLAPIVKF